MNEVVIEHIKVNELPEAWCKKFAGAERASVPVRIEQEEVARREQTTQEQADDPLFGMLRNREDMADVAAYVRKLRVLRY